MIYIQMEHNSIVILTGDTFQEMYTYQVDPLDTDELEGGPWVSLHLPIKARGATVCVAYDIITLFLVAKMFPIPNVQRHFATLYNYIVSIRCALKKLHSCYTRVDMRVGIPAIILEVRPNAYGSNAYGSNAYGRNGTLNGGRKNSNANVTVKSNQRQQKYT